jgi:hypothetical protein
VFLWANLTARSLGIAILLVVKVVSRI